MTHDGNNRRTRFQIFFGIFFLYNGLCHFRTDIFSLVSEFFRHQINGFSIQTLIDRHHDTDTHTSSNNLSYGNIHHTCQFVGSHKFRYLQYFAIRHFAVFLFLHTAVRHIALVLTIFGSLALTFGSESCQSFFYLLSYIFLTNLLFDDRFLEAILVIVVTVVVLVATLVIVTTTGTLLTTACMRTFASTTTIVISTLEVGCIVNVNLLLIIINTKTFLLVGIGIGLFFLTILRFIVFAADFFDNRLFHLLLLILTDFLLLFALLPFLLFSLLLGACRLVQRSQVNLTDDIDFGNKLRLMDGEDFISLLCWCFFCNCRFHFFLSSRCYGSRRFLFYFFFCHYRSRSWFLYNFRFQYFFHHRSRFGFRIRFRLWFRPGLWFGLWFGFGLRLRFDFRLRLRFRFFLYHRYGFFYFLFFHFLYYRFPVQLIQINFSDRFKLRTCIFGDNSLNFFHFRFIRSFSFVTIYGYRCFVTIFILSFLNKTFRFKSKILICTELFHEQGVLLLVNLCVGVCLNGKAFLLQELNYCRNSYIQISCYFI